jgi:exodeoxyribonuclease VII small subunit
MARKTPTYGEAAERLETILRKIEDGEVDLDELGDLVTEAASLVELCRKKIEASEMKVRKVTEKLARDAESNEPLLDPRD